MNQDILIQIGNSGTCWIILLVAAVCYQQLFALWLTPVEQREFVKDITPTLIKVLPLLGLLGTIMGLLSSFAALRTGASGTDLFSQGVGDALLTTQLGLLCAVPAWTIHSAIKSSENKQRLAHGE